MIKQYRSLCGLAVTIPYKEKIIPFLNEVDNSIPEIGAVNCIKVSNDFLSGYNTDVIGFEKSLVPLLKSHHSKALVLGNGGASKAVQFVLRKLHITFLIATRSPAGVHGHIRYETIDKKTLNDYPLIINTTPLGMYPDVDSLPQLPYHFLSDKNFLYDLIYTPEETAFLKSGKLQGATIKNGYEMLVLQAEENWRIWNQ